MYGSYGPAIAHLQSGNKIICEINFDVRSRTHRHDTLRTSHAPYVPMETLEQLFLSTSLHIFQVSSLLNELELSVTTLVGIFWCHGLTNPR
jgi:hypothetical protein